MTLYTNTHTHTHTHIHKWDQEWDQEKDYKKVGKHSVLKFYGGLDKFVWVQNIRICTRVRIPNAMYRVVCILSLINRCPVLHFLHYISCKVRKPTPPQKYLNSDYQPPWCWVSASDCKSNRFLLILSNQVMGSKANSIGHVRFVSPDQPHGRAGTGSYRPKWKGWENIAKFHLL